MRGAVTLERPMNEQSAEASTPDAGAAEPTPRAEVKSLSFFYGKNQALKSVKSSAVSPEGDFLDRPFRLRQEHALTLFQPAA